MAQALIRRLNDQTLEDYRAVAKANGRSLEAELRHLIERNRPARKKSAAELFAMSEQACLLTVGGMSSDSTPYIRWVRDTSVGRSESFVGDAAK